jgi:hypothetical protein
MPQHRILIGFDLDQVKQLTQTPAKPGAWGRDWLKATWPLGRPCSLRLTRKLSVRPGALPPHPSPLPWGEGEPPPGCRLIERDEWASVRPRALPLPWGEGWGEGERTANRPGSQRSRSCGAPECYPTPIGMGACCEPGRLAVRWCRKGTPGDHGRITNSLSSLASC